MSSKNLWFLDTNIIVKELVMRWKKNTYSYSVLLSAKEKYNISELWTSLFVISEVAGRLTEEYLLRKLWREGYPFLDIKEMREEELADLFRKHFSKRSEKSWKRLRSRYESLISSRLYHFIRTTGIHVISVSDLINTLAEDMLKEELSKESPEAVPAFITLIVEAWGATATALSLIPLKLSDAVVLADAATLIDPSGESRVEFLTTDRRLINAKKDIERALKAVAENYPFISTNLKVVDASDRGIRFKKLLE